MALSPDASEPTNTWIELAKAADQFDAVLHEFRNDLWARAVAAGLAGDVNFAEAVSQLANDVPGERQREVDSLEERRQRWGA